MWGAFLEKKKPRSFLSFLFIALYYWLRLLSTNKKKTEQNSGERERVGKKNVCNIKGVISLNVESIVTDEASSRR